MRKKYDRDKVFEMISESYELGLGPVAYCKEANFPVEVFYRYRQQYVKLYGAAAMPTKSDSFVALELPTPMPPIGLSLEIGAHIRLRFDRLPDATYLSELVNRFTDASLK